MSVTHAFHAMSTVLCLVSACLLGGACGNDREPTPATPLTADEYPLARAEATCDYEFRCCTPSERGENLPEGASPTDAAACPGVTAAELRTLLDGRVSSGDTYDDASAGECVAAIRSLACGRSYEIKDIPACRAVTRGAGTTANGASCGEDSDCVSNYCSYPPTGFPECAQPVSTIGTECTPGEGCAGPGEYCDEGTMRCAASKERGASCTGIGFECRGSLRCEEGRCDYQSRPGCGGA